MLSCKDVSVRVSESLDRELPLREQLGVRLHLLICKACRRMVRQMAVLRALSRRYGPDEEVQESLGETLSREARRRISERLRDADGDSGDAG